ncbi:MAG: malate synthase A [Pirellulaceae bacterium]|nr:malate synthase A [Pirellulaceae bacterium]
MLEAVIEGQIPGVEIMGAQGTQTSQVLTPGALSFLAKLTRQFATRRDQLLRDRVRVQAALDDGWLPDFPAETQALREADWRIAPVPVDLQDRRVEITGPVDRKMVINALNSGARMFMADFEDSHAPTWEGTLEGQINLRDAVLGTIEYTSPDGKRYSLNPSVATLLVRPRGWHLLEKHLLVDGQPIPASLFDFGLFLFHNAHVLRRKGSGPYFYLPKLENRHEARLWNDVFVSAQNELGLPRGSIRATVLIETILAAFEMDEILFELRDHVCGLNCGRWDYIFSFIKKFRKRPEFVLPNRSQVTMSSPFLRSYSQLLIQTCHRRSAHAMGGMAAQIPIKNDPPANEIALKKVRDDKLREVNEGHDGTWVAHPGLVSVAKEVFDTAMPGAHQLHVGRQELRVSAKDLLQPPAGTITLAGLRTNINVSLMYLEAWLRGNGCVPLYNLMEDAATAEISRAQIWQWIRHPRGVLDDGRKVTIGLFQELLAEELASLERELGDVQWKAGRHALAAKLLDDIIVDDCFAEFLTLRAYDYLP